MKRSLLIFAREPAPRDTKTRLSPILADEARVAFYTAMLEDLAAMVRGVACDRRVVCWAPDSEPRELPLLFVGTELDPQAGADLGERMAHSLSEALEDVSAAAVLIGSDVPLLTAEVIESAFERLRDADIALGPCFDGGYYLIGARCTMRTRLGELFHGIPWSRSDVFEAACGRFSTVLESEPGSRLAVLPMLYDVDTPEDYRLLAAHLYALELAGEPTPPRTHAFVREHPAPRLRAAT